ncbi:MAG: hypothetical protein ACRC1W_01285 [Shewanella sp.]
MISETGIWGDEETRTNNCPHSELLCFRLYRLFDTRFYVYDFGCGDGYYIRNLREMGYRYVMGFDGFIGVHNIDPGIEEIDLSKPYQAKSKGQVISLEVGEHIPKHYEQIFIDNLCNNCNSRMVISWAIEGQEGIGHVNCRNNSYVITEIERRGFKFNFTVTSYIRSDIEIGVSYFRNSLMVFDKDV